MDRTQKQQAVAEIKDLFTQSSAAVIVHYHGLTVDDITKLRVNARKNGTSLKVSKNTLAKIAANDTPFAGLANLLSGPTAIATSKDPVSAAKTIVSFAKENEKLKIVGGIIDGKVLDVSGVKSLASMPSLDESRAKIVGLLQAPASKLLSILQAPGGQIARVISAHSKKG